MAAQTPYAPPKSRVAAAEIRFAPSTPLAGSGRRFANFLLDWAFAWLFSILCGFAAGVAIGVLGVEGVNFNRLGQIIGLVGFNLYYVVFEASFGWTLAKLITGSRVVNETGGKPSLLKVLGRTLARSVPFEPFSFLGKTGIGWHDRWSGTRVVTIRPVEGPGFADSFKPGFRRDRQPARIEPTLAPAWIAPEGPPAWCPNCEREITATTLKCACGADFTSPEGWKPLAARPA